MTSTVVTTTPHKFAFISGASTPTMVSTFTCSTFKSDEDAARTAREVDILKLTESSITELKKKDPFMYFSVFKPSKGLRTSVINKVVALGQADTEDQQAASPSSPTLMVQRQTRVSTECDDVTAMLDILDSINFNDILESDTFEASDADK